MHAPVKQLAALSLVLVVAAACSSDATAPNRHMPDATSSAVAAPTGVAIDSVVGMTVYARWQDSSADNGGFYLVLSDWDNVQSTKKYQVVYGGDTTTGTITAYSQGCYLVSVFAWSGAGDSAWATTEPVGVSFDCRNATPSSRKGKGRR